MAITHRLMVWQMIQAGGEGVSPRPPEEIEAYREAQSDELEVLVGALSVSEEFDISGVKWYSLIDIFTRINAVIDALEAKDEALDETDGDLQDAIDALEARIETLEGYH